MLLGLALPVLADSPQLLTYGFFDVEWEQGNKDAKAKLGTFDQHHLTLIWQYRLSDYSLVFCETAYEHGPSLESGGGSGKIYLPKAYYELMRSDALKIRAGKFLPPFGIYNERHDATPTLLPTVLPQSVYGKHPNLSGPFADTLAQKKRAYPRFSTGVWILGSLYHGYWEFEYNLYLTNGRGAGEHQQDGNANKGLGSRVVVTFPFGPRLGLSYYSDQNCALADVEQSAMGLDLEYESGDLLLESGFVWPRFERLDLDGKPSGGFQDPRGAYLMLGYTLAGGVTPFAYYDLYDPDLELDNDQERDLVVGVNHPLSDRAFIKGEVHNVSFEDASRESYRNFIMSLTVAF